MRERCHATVIYMLVYLFICLLHPPFVRPTRLPQVRAVIVDEVDNMLQDPFQGELQTILDATPIGRLRGARPASPSSSWSSFTTSPFEGDADESEEGYDIDEEEIEEEEGGEEEYEEEGVEARGQEDFVTGNGDGDVDSSDDVVGKGVGTGTGSNKGFLCLASATGNAESVKSFIAQYMRPDHVKVAVEAGTALPSSITHALISTPRMRALEMLKR